MVIRQGEGEHLTSRFAACITRVMESLWNTVEPFSTMGSVLLSFGLILVLTRLKAPVWAAILGGAITAIVLFDLRSGALDDSTARSAGQIVGHTGALIGKGVVQPVTIAVAIIVAGLLVFSKLMRDTGRIERMVGLMRSILRRPAVAMAAMPAAIGMIPMPGGALFSAPMVRAAAGGTDVPGVQLSAINFWYRHPWEFWWPLYPGVMLALQMASDQFGITMGIYVAAMLPMSVVMIVAGLWVFRGSHPDLHKSSEKPPAGAKRDLLAVMTPIWMVLGVFIVGKLAIWLLTPHLPTRIEWGFIHTDIDWKFIGKYIVTIVAIVASLAWLMRTGKIALRKVGRMFATLSVGKLVLVVASAMVFMYALEQVDAGRAMAQEMDAMGIPAVAVVALLPFIAGVVLGVAIGFVGTAFPIVLPLVAGTESPMAYVMLAYVFGHMGQMLSPIHVCQIVTLEYFDSSYRAIYPRIIPPALFTCTAAIAYFLLLRAMGV
jgi:hypothetical protein